MKHFNRDRCLLVFERLGARITLDASAPFAELASFDVGDFGSESVAAESAVRELVRQLQEDLPSGAAESNEYVVPLIDSHDVASTFNPLTGDGVLIPIQGDSELFPPPSDFPGDEPPVLNDGPDLGPDLGPVPDHDPGEIIPDPNAIPLPSSNEVLFAVNVQPVQEVPYIAQTEQDRPETFLMAQANRDSTMDRSTLPCEQPDADKLRTNGIHSESYFVRTPVRASIGWSTTSSASVTRSELATSNEADSQAAAGLHDEHHDELIWEQAASEATLPALHDVFLQGHGVPTIQPIQGFSFLVVGLIACRRMTEPNGPESDWLSQQRPPRFKLTSHREQQ